MNAKLLYAIQLIKKYHIALNVQKTDTDHIVFLFDYVSGNKSINTIKIQKAVERAMKQQDYPKEVIYNDGMLHILNPEKSVIIEKTVEVESSVEVETETETETVVEETVVEAPKKRAKKTKITE